MPRTEFLWLPLIGGYFFATILYATRFYIGRKSGQDLIFWSGLFGALLLVLSTSILQLAEWKLLHFIGPFPYPFHVTQLEWASCLSLLIGLVPPWLINLYGNRIQKKLETKTFSNKRTRHIQYSRKAQYLTRSGCVDREITRMKDDVRTLLREAIGAGELVCITLGTGKVYLGKVRGLYDPLQPIQSIRLTLERSGYREKETGFLKWNTDYQLIRKKAIPSAAKVSQREAIRQKRLQEYRENEERKLGPFKRARLYLKIAFICIVGKIFRRPKKNKRRFRKRMIRILIRMIRIFYRREFRRIVKRKVEQALLKDPFSREPVSEIVISYSEIKTIHYFIEEFDDQCSTWHKEPKKSLYKHLKEWFFN